MRLLFTIPHFFDPKGGGVHGSLARDPKPRLQALTACLTALRQLAGRPQCMIDIGRRLALPANQAHTYQIGIAICTTQDRHLLGQLSLPAHLYTHRPTQAAPQQLGFECHQVLRDNLGRFDYYCYLEDDIILQDPWFFAKLRWFAEQAGSAYVLQPNRFEASPAGPVGKAYLDGDLAPHVIAPFLDEQKLPELKRKILGVPVRFRQARNPHAGCFFLTAEQMAYWAKRPDFGDRDTSFIGPLESAATLGLLRTFRVYKPAPANADFLEVLHHDTAFLRQVGTMVPLDGQPAAIRACESFDICAPN
jgi:hypothetical protein